MAAPKYATKEYHQAKDRPPLDPGYAAGLLAREKKENFKILQMILISLKMNKIILKTIIKLCKK